MFKPKLLAAAMLAVPALALSNALHADPSTLTVAQARVDQHTFANLAEVVSKHVSLDLAVNFEQKQFEGYIEHQLQWLDKSAHRLVLDTRDLVINKVETVNEQGQWQAADFTLGARDDVKGSPLTITFAGQPSKVRVYYHSTEKASGLQWLSKEQTAGKKLPFVFSQSQAIHARSWLPIQDSPAMRVTYDAHITTPKNVRAVMSADNSQNSEVDGDYVFTMPQAIPTYLIAIGAGDLGYQSMSKQTAVYAEPYILQASAEEFADTQAMIEATSKMYGEYAWGRYDLLMLPPSFPFGGMENPRLSFITPTVVAGDKSLVSLIAHELAHSWSGNLVTNATWEDLWLNEGFTSYVENRIMEQVYGKDRAVMEQALSVADLKAEIAELPAADTRLRLELNGRDPDDAFSGVPYTKGQMLLMYLEEKFGRDKFDTFVKGYFADHAFQSVTTTEFLQYLDKNLLQRYPNVVSMTKVHEWVYQPGLPTDAPNPQSNAFELVQAQLDKFLAGQDAKSLAYQHWSVHEWLYFINNLPRDLSQQQMQKLDNAFSFTQTHNNEIAFAWFMLAIDNGYSAADKAISQYLINIGRRKFIVPIYKKLLEKGHKARAQQIYQQARPGYHPLAQSTLDPLLK